MARRVRPHLCDSAISRTIVLERGLQLIGLVIVLRIPASAESHVMSALAH
jgi:hypothetical protein